MKKINLLKLPIVFVAISFLCSCGNNLFNNNNENQFDSGDVIDGNIFADQDAQIATKVNIVFDAGTGIFTQTGLSTKTIVVKSGMTWGRIKDAAPTNYDISIYRKKLMHWTIKDGASYREIKDDDKFDGTKKNVVLKAHYADVNYVMVTFDSGVDDDGNPIGYFANIQSLTSIERRVEFGATYKDIVVADYVPKPNWDHSNLKFSHFENDLGEPVYWDYVFTRTQKITAKWIESTDSYTTSSFENDDWDTFVKAINSDYYDGHWKIRNYSHGEYGGYQEDYENNGYTFIGLERKVEINGKEYRVRVVDECRDATEDNWLICALTFEFVDAVEIGVAYDINNSNVYSNSSIEAYLNNQLIRDLPEPLTRWDSLIRCKKTTCKGAGDESTGNSSERLWLPSLKEIGVESIDLGGGVVVPTPNEGEVYSYYANFKPEDRSAERIRKFDDNNVRYFLRSPQAETNAFAYYVDEEGNVKESIEANKGLAICPMFGLGRSYY